MNTREIEAWLAWLDDMFGLDYRDDELGSVASLWGHDIARYYSIDDSKHRLVGHFMKQTCDLYNEWKNYNE